MIHNPTNSKLGYTLVELAVVLTILSMLITVIITIVPFTEEKESIQVTQTNLQKIEEAILSHYNQKGYIPCPSALDADIASATFGVSSTCATAGSVANAWTDVNTGVDRIRIGAVPTRELNISDSFAFDGWNNRLTYVAIANLAQTDGLFNLHKTSTDEIISIIDSAGNQINQINPSQVAFILISHGRDGAGSTNYTGGTVLTCNADNSEENCNNDAIFRDQFINVDSAANYFDDYLTWKTKEQVMTEGDYAGTGGGTTAKFSIFVSEFGGGTNIARDPSDNTTPLNNSGLISLVHNSNVELTANTLIFPEGRYLFRQSMIGCGNLNNHFITQIGTSPDIYIPSTAEYAEQAAGNSNCSLAYSSYDYTVTGAPYATQTFFITTGASTSSAGRGVTGAGGNAHYNRYIEVWEQ